MFHLEPVSLSDYFSPVTNLGTKRLAVTTILTFLRIRASITRSNNPPTNPPTPLPILIHILIYFDSTVSTVTSEENISLETCKLSRKI